jgi:uncharacterized membrane protein
MVAYIYSHHMGWGWGVLMTLGWLILLGLFFALLLGARRDRRSGPSARELLDKRLASGEISLEEYRQARAAMSPEQSDLPAGPPAPA